jgi:hypothetical protein
MEAGWLTILRFRKSHPCWVRSIKKINDMKHLLAIVWLLGALFGAAEVTAATTWSTQDYDLYPGDFTQSGKTGFLFIARNPNEESGIALSDGSGPNVLWQSWPGNYLGISWSTGGYNIIVADFNGDGRSDILLQARASGGTSYLLITDSHGHVSGTPIGISASALGLAWTGDQHQLTAGDFNGDGRADLFFQATSVTGTHAIVLADGNGQFSSGPAQTWTDGYLRHRIRGKL